MRLLETGRPYDSTDVLTVLYILVFSTVVSAMTGYRTSMQPVYLTDENDGAPLSFANLKQVFSLEVVVASRLPDLDFHAAVGQGNVCFSDISPGVWFCLLKSVPKHSNTVSDFWYRFM